MYNIIIYLFIKDVHFYSVAPSYCAYERGSNENNNRFIRRFIDKGVDIKRYSNRDIKNIEEYMNNYPRKMFGGLSSNEVYDMAAIP